MRSLFVTGIGGFIGAALAGRALARGATVSGVDLDPKAVERARALGARAAVADVAERAGLERAMRELAAGADTVIHTAAIVREHGPLGLFRAVNVRGSASVAELARALDVRTFVQLSSVMVYGFDYPRGVGEDGPLRGEGNPYCESKIESEAAVRALATDGFGVIVIRPGDVYGPGSQPWIARPVELLRRRRMLLPGGGRGILNHVYVENLVDGIFAAVDRGAHGQTYNLTDGQATSYRDFYGRLARLAGLPGPTVVPTPVMRVLVRVAGKLHELGLGPDEASPDTVRYLLRPHAYGIDKARRELDYAPRVSLDEGLARTRPYVQALLAGSAA